MKRKRDATFLDEYTFYHTAGRQTLLIFSHAPNDIHSAKSVLRGKDNNQKEIPEGRAFWFLFFNFSSAQHALVSFLLYIEKNVALLPRANGG